MSSDEIEFECEEAMEKAVDFLRHELRTVRTGRASPGLVSSMLFANITCSTKFTGATSNPGTN